MIQAVIFDMFESLITHYQSPLYFGPQMVADAGIPVENFQRLWTPTKRDRSIGKLTFEEVLSSNAFHIERKGSFNRVNQ